MGGEWEDSTRIIAPEQAAEAAAAKEDRAYLIVLAGTSIGEMHKLATNRTLLGRGPQADIKILEEGVSRGHAEIVSKDGSLVLRDLKSTNGTYCNGEKILGEHVLKDGDKIQIGSTTILKFTFNDALDENFQRQMYDAALRDGLTKAYNKKYFLERLEAEFAYASRHQSMLSLVMTDIDHFKSINDKYGHLGGDQALIALANVVHRVMRQEDVFARYGGEEFAVLLRGIGLDGAASFAERLRQEVANIVVHYENTPIVMTTSLGVASYSPAVDSPIELIRRADDALYEAKRGGRNRVVKSLAP